MPDRMRKPQRLIAALALAALLCGCGLSMMPGGESQTPPPAQHKPRPSDRLLTQSDMHACERQLGITPPKTAAQAYALSPDAIPKIKTCAYALEKKRMPLLADLIGSYQGMIEQGNAACDKDLGTHYAAVCLRKNVESAKAWYDKAVTQRIGNDLPGQFSAAPAP